MIWSNEKLTQMLEEADMNGKIKGMEREKKLQKKKGQMKLNGAGLKKIILPLLGKKAKEK